MYLPPDLVDDDHKPITLLLILQIPPNQLVNGLLLTPLHLPNFLLQLQILDLLLHIIQPLDVDVFYLLEVVGVTHFVAEDQQNFVDFFHGVLDRGDLLFLDELS